MVTECELKSVVPGPKYQSYVKLSKRGMRERKLFTDWCVQVSVLVLCHSVDLQFLQADTQFFARDMPFLPPANEVWGKVKFSQACIKNSVHRVGVVPGPGGCGDPAPGTATAAGGMHPTGMYSCLFLLSLSHSHIPYPQLKNCKSGP